MDKTIQKSEFKVIVLCRAAKMSRQNYYKLRCVRRRRTVDEAFVSELVKRERRLQPMLGTRKLLHILSDEFCKAGIRIGRDRLFEVLRGNKLLILKRRGFKAEDDGQQASVWSL